MKKILLYLSIAIFMFGCTHNDGKDVFLSRRGNIINVQDKIQAIDLGEVFVSSRGIPVVAGEYFVLGDMKSVSKTIHVFDIRSFRHLASTGQFGQGPHEITALGNVVWNPSKREIYAIDHGKSKIYAYNIDSVISNPNFNPYEKMQMDLSLFPAKIEFISDTMSFCRVIKPTSVSTFTESTGIINLKTGDIKLLEYNHPDVNAEQKSINIAISKSDKIYAICHWNSDLISLFDFEGNLIANVFGPYGTDNGFTNYTRCVFSDKYLIAAYNGKESKKFEPTNQCFLFTKSGEYLATLNVGYNILEICYDEHNDRLIFWFDDDIQLGYLDLKKLNW